MTPERWQEIENLYHAVQERGPAAMDGAEPELRREVESLLAKDSASELPAVRPGATLGPYEILERIGAGGMGEVWKAQDTRLGRFVAIKTSRDRFGERFAGEARAVAALNHPNICTLYDVGPAYLVMELISGRSLDHIIPKKGMRLSEVLRYGVEIADALAAAHTRRIVHRDLKPSNVMVTDQGRVKVLDFGLARLSVQPPEASATQTATFAIPETAEGTIVGTVAYMSPEQAQGLPVDARSDVFSFGVLLYEMITGERAFRGATNVATLAAVVKDEPKPARSLAGHLPPELERIITRCLRKDPARRFQNMSDLHVALTELKEEAASGSLNPAPSATVVASSRKRTWLWATFVVVAMAAATAGLWAWRGLREAVPPPKLVPVTSYPGFQQQGVLSPDGRQVAFAWDGEKGDRNNFDIYVKLIGQPDALRLTTDPTAEFSPAWSPDGRQIAFRRNDGIFTISALGGAERRLGQGFSSVGPAPMLSWAPNGSGIAVASAKSIVVVPADGGEPRSISSPPEGEHDISPAFSRDGQELAFFRCGAGPVSCALNIQALDAGFRAIAAPRKIARKLYFPLGGIAWSADGKSLVFGGSRYWSIGDMWRVPADGGSPEQRIELVGWPAQSPSVAGDRLLFTRPTNHSDIWRYREGSGVAPFIRSTLWEHGPQFSPDGTRIAFQTAPTKEGDQIWVARADGTGRSQVTAPDVIGAGWPHWSPDSKWLVFRNQREDGFFNIAVLEAAGGSLRNLVVRGDNQNPSFSLDGNSIWFPSNRTGRPEVWRVPFAAGQEEQFTRNGGGSPVESPDGKTLYYLKDHLLREIREQGASYLLFAQDTGGGPERQVLSSPVYGRAYAPVQDGIWFIGSVGTRKDFALQFFRFSDRSTHVAAPLGSAVIPFGNLSVSPDGKTTLFSVVANPGSVLEMIEGFR